MLSYAVLCFTDADPELDPEKVRKYEQDKLLYYYAVLTCDSERTARHIYQVRASPCVIL